MNPISMIILGPPKTGKSSAAGTICEVVPPEEVLLQVFKPGEESTWIYQKYGLDKRAELYYDEDWRPSIGLYEARAFDMLNRRLYDLRKDEQYAPMEENTAIYQTTYERWRELYEKIGQL